MISADEIVHQLLSKKSEVWDQVVNLLGLEILTDKNIDREKVANKVFKNPQLLTKLENLLHPYVRKIIHETFNQVKGDPSVRIFVAEVPLLFESGMEQDFDITIAVTAEKKKCMERSWLSPKEFKMRSKRLLPDVERKLKADYVIQNKGSLAELKADTIKIFNLITGV
ncbi:MAG: dephospho-CoA kinase [Chlamydiales bacterium]